MALPATDNFNRADSNPAGVPWVKVGLASDVRILTNRLTAAGPSVGFVYWNADTPAEDQYSQCIVPTSGSEVGGPAIRILTSSANRDGYRYNISGKVLQKLVNNVTTTLQTMTDTVSNTAVYRLEAIGTTIRVYKDGVQLGTDVTDTSFSSGSVGIYHGGSSGYYDNWEGGETNPATVLTANNSTQVNASTSSAIGQENIITAGNSSQANTSSSGAIVQVILGEMLADNSTQVNQSISGGVIQSHTVTAGNSTQVNGSTTGAITMTHVLSADNSIQANLSITGAIGQLQILTAANSVQANLSDSGRMLLTPGFWYDESDEAITWLIDLDGNTMWSPSPPITSIWS